MKEKNNLIVQNSQKIKEFEDLKLEISDLTFGKSNNEKDLKREIRVLKNIFLDCNLIY